MAKSLDLVALVETLGPRFAEGAAERDACDIFIAVIASISCCNASASAPAIAARANTVTLE